MTNIEKIIKEEKVRNPLTIIARECPPGWDLKNYLKKCDDGGYVDEVDCLMCWLMEVDE